ncbi:MAG: sigma-70 family RNA polymerase sigma factor [Phycisphaerales bacterium]
MRDCGGPMLATARRFFRGEDDAAEAVQEAFVSAFKAIGRFDGGSRLSTWLHRITVNACLMKLRGRRRRPERSIEELLPAFEQDGHQRNPAVEWKPAEMCGIERAELRTLVRGCIEGLPEGYREVLMLRDIEGLDTNATAEALGLTANAVKIRLHRARLALREALDPHMRSANEGRGAR